MRIIGGKHKGRKLIRVGKDTTRETADMVKESVFNMLGGTTPGIVLDLFAGAGSYGLEALSRGADYLYAVDLDKDAIKTLIENAKTIGELDKINISHKPYHRFIHALSDDVLFDLVFLDPPYDMEIYEQTMLMLLPHLNERAIIVCESRKNVILSDNVASLEKIKDKTYGLKRISVYQK